MQFPIFAKTKIFHKKLFSENCFSCVYRENSHFSIKLIPGKKHVAVCRFGVFVKFCCKLLYPEFYSFANVYLKMKMDMNMDTDRDMDRDTDRDIDRNRDIDMDTNCDKVRDMDRDRDRATDRGTERDMDRDTDRKWTETW
jgi:hypothetical protein